MRLLWYLFKGGGLGDESKKAKTLKVGRWRRFLGFIRVWWGGVGGIPQS